MKAIINLKKQNVRKFLRTATRLAQERFDFCGEGAAMKKIVLKITKTKGWRAV